MNQNGINPENLMALIKAYVKINSETGTEQENLAAAFMMDHFGQMDYFKMHNDHLGLYFLVDDPLKRAVAWALVKGTGRRTVVFVHHCDVVGIEDFMRFKDLAFDPDALTSALKADPDVLESEARRDLLSDQWLFGRGTADMKAGGAIQMAFVEAYCQQEDFDGNLLLIQVPDEENLSAGMRGAARLLAELQTTMALDYVLMINSEPHQRKTQNRGIFSGGSIGKLMPFFYSRGILAHAGKSAEGFNPLSILSECIRRTEMNPDYSDLSLETGEIAPLPTWLMARDSKTAYDVSMPLSAFGCLSIQPLDSRPNELLEKLKQMGKDAALEAADRVNKGADYFDHISGKKPRLKKWEPEVRLFGPWLAEKKATYGSDFENHYEATRQRLSEEISSGNMTFATGTWLLLDALFEYTGCHEPTLVIGIVPPFYPSVSYVDRPDFKMTVSALYKDLNHEAEQSFGMSYDLEAYFTGISDLSYTSISHEDLAVFERVIPQEMPFYGSLYAIPFEEIVKIAMPCINIGPWGKDFHKISERVLIEDVLVRTPHLIQSALDWVLKDQ
jgi:arginine utilization protein RocB